MKTIETKKYKLSQVVRKTFSPEIEGEIEQVLTYVFDKNLNYSEAIRKVFSPDFYLQDGASEIINEIHNRSFKDKRNRWKK